MASPPPQKRVLVPIATGSEEIETACVVDILRRAGADVTVASCNTDSALVVKMSRGMNFLADAAVTACANNTYDLIALPGGMPGASGLAASPVLLALLKAQAARGAPYAAMCAAPAVVLEPAGLLNKAATAHPAFVDKLGARREAVAARVVVDGNCITSRGPGTALEFSLALVAVLFGRDKAAEVAKPLVMPTPAATPLLPHEWRLQ